MTLDYDDTHTAGCAVNTPPHDITLNEPGYWDGPKEMRWNYICGKFYIELKV